MDPKPNLAQNDGIDRNLALVLPQPVNHPGLRVGPGGLAKHVRIDQVGHKVSVDSDSMGTKKPFSGQDSSQSTDPRWDEANGAPAGILRDQCVRTRTVAPA